MNEIYLPMTWSGVIIDPKISTEPDMRRISCVSNKSHIARNDSAMVKIARMSRRIVAGYEVR